MSSLYARMVELKNASFQTLQDSIGPAVVMTGKQDIATWTPEVWGVPGVWVMPPDSTWGIRLPVGGDEHFAPVIATHHYKTPRPTLAKGETAIGATNTAGDTLGAKTVYRGDGTQELNGTGKFLVTHAELNVALQTMLTLINANFALKLNGAGATGTATLDISTAKAATLKTG